MKIDVLLVDDEVHIRKALGRLLRHARISVESVPGAEQALEWLESHQANLILSDYRMPGMTGTEFLAKVEARWPDTVRIILSGHSDFDTVLDAVHSGVVHKFLAKPWSNQELIEHIKTSLVSQQSQLPDTDSHTQPEPENPPDADASEVQLQVVLDTVVDGIVTIDSKGAILSVNAAMEKIFGYVPAELIGENVSMLMPEPYRSQHDHYLAQYQSPGQKGILGNQRRLVGLRKNGEVFPIELGVNSMAIEGSTQFLGMIRDISRRVSAERENQLLVDALEIAQDGVALFGAGDRLVHCNQQFRQLYRRAGVELQVGQTYQEFFRDCLTKGLFSAGQADPEGWLERQMLIHAELPVVKEYELQPGQWIEIHETLAENGSVIVSHLDISKQKQTQHSLEQAVAEAEHANSARAKFLAMMSHEIRTPLNGVLGLLQLLQETNLESEQSRYVDGALSSGRGLLTIISDILDFSKIEADKMVLIPAPCQLSALIEELHQLFQLRIEEKSIQLDMTIEPGVPRWVELDGQRLRQVLINLIGNAIKFTDYGQVTMRIGEREGRLQFAIQDTGIGIPDADQSKIFSEFTTITHSAEQPMHEGTGLGLAISHKLVDMMGGCLGFQSEQGAGSEFWFDLPLIEAQAPERSNDEKSQALSGRILVVDDSATNRLVARTMLEHLDLKVSCAADGSEAIQCYQQQPYDLILMDISMPGISGVDTLQQLRQLPEWRDTPVIAFTAYALEEEKQRFAEAGMQGHLEKPLDKTVLLQTIAPFLTATDIKSELPEQVAAAVEADVSAINLVDTAKLDQLARDTSEEVLPELAKVFLDDARARIEQLTGQSTDVESVERHLHTLGSSALLYGLQRMAEQARTLEALCQQGSSVTGLLDEFITLANLSLQALQESLQQRSG